MPMIIHGSILSPFVRKVTFVAMEKNLEFQSSNLNPFAPPADFEKMSPLKRIPVLEDDGFMLADSSAIVAYLEAKQAAPALLPNEPKELGQAIWIEEYADTALASDIGLGVFRPAIVNPMMGKPVDEETIKETITNVLPIRFNYLNQQLEGKQWFAGEQVSLADISIYSQLMSLFYTDHLPSAEDYPALMSHFSRMQDRPVAQKMLQQEGAYLKAVTEQAGG